MGVIKFRIENFSAYGLNKYRNFMTAPECECGCGGDAHLILESNDDLFGFISAVLDDYDWDGMSAIFAIDYDGAMYVGVRDPDSEDDGIEIMGIPDLDMEFFAEVDADYCFDRYGLIIEVEPNEWKVI